jgi:predicted O-methyltransferase YrrM
MTAFRTRPFLSRLLDLLLAPLVLPAGLLLKVARRAGLQRLPLSRRMLLGLGVLPVRDHYYEPFIRSRDLRTPPESERSLPGIDWNLDEQLELLGSLRFGHELTDLRAPRTDPLDFRLGNASFESGDAEFLYQMVRLKKPRRVIEIGSGNSTLLVRRAIAMNRRELPTYECEHLCIEPYEAPWLEQAGVRTLRMRVEDVDRSLFQTLGENDLLFIDSSHVIRPQGDVVVEYLEILPSLRTGVIVHIHDIFSPRDYPRDWLLERMYLWDEQYLLEAFLTGNRDWKVLAALNLLRHRQFEALQRVCPYLTPDREPGSFYMQKVN